MDQPVSSKAPELHTPQVSPYPRFRRGLGSILPAAILALVIVVLGIPQTIDSIETLYVTAGINPADPGPTAKLEGETAVVGLERIGGQFHDAHALIRAGSLRRDVDSLRVEPGDLDKARDDLITGLTRAPANALGWTELADVAYRLGDALEAKSAWRQSIQLARYNPALNLWRARIGLHLWLSLDASDRIELARQISYAWDDDLEPVVGLANSSAFIASIVRAALAEDGERLLQFDRRVKKPS